MSVDFRLVAANEMAALVADTWVYVAQTSLGTVAHLRAWLMGRPEARNARSATGFVLTLGGTSYAVVDLHTRASRSPRDAGEAAPVDDEPVTEIEITKRGGDEAGDCSSYDGRVLADLADLVGAAVLDCQTGNVLTANQFRVKETS